MSEKLSEETRALMGTFAAAESALAEAAAVWRQFRQPRVDTAAGHKRADAMEREARFRLANAALLWLWHVEERAARAEARPVDMVLHCPACGLQHIDEATPEWDNPPHRSHLCLGCGHIWRPADIATNGVATLQTRGKSDSPLAEARPAPVVDDATGGPVPGPLTQEIVASIGLHHSTAALVNRFAHALAEKLAKAEQKYGYSDGWARDDWQDECRRQLHHHAAKGDPRDVAAYAAFCWHHGWSTARPTPVGDREAVARIVDPIAFKCWQATYDYGLRIGDSESEALETAEWAHGKSRDEALAKADAILALLSPATSPGEGSSGAESAARIASDHAASETLRKSDWVCNSCGAPFTSSGGKIIGGTCPNGRPTCPLVPA
jgi:hypothetical protein